MFFFFCHTWVYANSDAGLGLGLGLHGPVHVLEVILCYCESSLPF